MLLFSPRGCRKVGKDVFDFSHLLGQVLGHLHALVRDHKLAQIENRDVCEYVPA